MSEPKEIYDKALVLYECEKEHMRRAEEAKNMRMRRLEEYRVESVCRVLDFIRMNTKRIDPRKIDTLLCHCQNKLRGNIDGIELTLDSHFFKEEGKLNESTDE